MGDSFTPDVGQHVNADGTVNYDFSGHVHAQGVDLDEAFDGSPDTANQVRWLDPNGAEAGSITVLFDGIDDQLVATVRNKVLLLLTSAGVSGVVQTRFATDLALAWNAANGTLDVYQSGVRVAQLT